MNVLHKTKDEFTAKMWRDMQAFPAYYDYAEVDGEFHCFEIQTPPNQKIIKTKFGALTKLN